MVFVHGGGFVQGSSSPAQYGAEFLVKEDVILVTVNYRYILVTVNYRYIVILVTVNYRYMVIGTKKIM